MQYRSLNATLDSCCQTVCIATYGGRTCPILFTIQLNGAPACFFLLSCSPNDAMQINVFSYPSTLVYSNVMTSSPFLALRCRLLSSQSHYKRIVNVLDVQLPPDSCAMSSRVRK